MRATPFDEKMHLAPIPFELSVCQAAKKLKQRGLDWTPHAGCFVWDEFKTITVPSPFPNHIYFILNLGHFLKIFGTIQNLREKMVWIPTEYQAHQLAQKIGNITEQSDTLTVHSDPLIRLTALYELLEIALIQKK